MKKTKIEWCDSSWNPITGCYHTCPYCYARQLANRYKGFDGCRDGHVLSKTVVLEERKHKTTENGVKRGAPYPYNFTPTFHRYRLSEPSMKGKLGETIFVCSMADMFGDWVPDDWINEIFDACLAAPDHRYLFLTKNPKRYLELANKKLLPTVSNFWYGTTCETPEQEYFYSDDHNTFVSIEPILKPFTGIFLDKPRIDWAILGAETGNRKGKVIPEKDWVSTLVGVCEEYQIPVFMKDSMKPVWGDDILTQFPWEDRAE